MQMLCFASVPYIFVILHYTILIYSEGFFEGGGQFEDLRYVAEKLCVFLLSSDSGW